MKSLMKQLITLMVACVSANIFMADIALAADKAITAHIVLDSQLGTTAIEDEATADARVVIDAMEDNPDTNEQGATWSYAWSHIATEYRNSPDAAWGQAAAQATVPNVDAPTNTISTNFDTAGYYRVRFRVSIEFKPATGDDVWKGEATAEATQIVIGGPITGGHEARFRCTIDNPQYTVSATLQPAGTTYTWAWSSSGQGQIEFVDPATALTVGQWSGITGLYSQLTFRGRAGSLPRDDVSIRVVYTLNGVTYTSPAHTITVRKPTNLSIADQDAPNRLYYPNSPQDNTRWYGFDGQWIHWRLHDQFGDPLGNETISEKWDDETSLIPHQPFGPIVTGITWQTVSDGRFNTNDNFLYYGLGRDNNGNDLLNNMGPPASVAAGTASHVFHSSANVGQGCIVGNFKTTWRTNRVDR